MNGKLTSATLGLVLILSACGNSRETVPQATPEYVLQAQDKVRPDNFPASVWMACDFELERKDITWIGAVEQKDIPVYPGNSAALAARPLAGTGWLLLTVRPVISHVIGADSRISFRYRLEGTDRILLQADIDRNAESRVISASGFAQGRWSSADVPLSHFAPVGASTDQDGLEGKRLQALTFMVDSRGNGARLVVDDVICYSAGEEEVDAGGAFPARVIVLESFDYPGEQHSLWMEHYHLERSGADSNHGVARGLSEGSGPGRRVRISIDPIQGAGAINRLRFHFMLKGAPSLQVQVFDLTSMDNRHILLSNLEQGVWRVADLDFTHDSRRNDGTEDTLRPGNLLDDIFFFTVGAADSCELYIDNAVLYDAGEE